MSLFRKNTDVYSVCEGNVKTLESLKDGVFSKKMMGDGLVISPDKKVKEIEILSPVAGTLVTAFHTGHAFGIKTKKGIEVLIHIGIDTVNLKGKGFKSLVKQDQQVIVGDKLVKVDLDFLRKNAPSADVIVIITSGQELKNNASGKVSIKDILFSVNK